MKPAFIKLRENYSSVAAVDQAALFGEIGWEDLIGKDSFANTCAIRVSLALIKAGVQLKGRMAIRKGPFKGALIEPGQAKLAHMLASPSMFGAPEKFNRDAAIAGIGQRQGLVAFFRIPGYLGGAGGHIASCCHPSACRCVAANATGLAPKCGSGNCADAYLNFFDRPREAALCARRMESTRSEASRDRFCATAISGKNSGRR